MQRALTLFSTLLLGAVLPALSARADTIVSVTQVSYDVMNRPVCTAVRMNPVAFSSPPADACALGSAGSYGPDRISKTIYDYAGQVVEVDQAVSTNSSRAYARYTYSSNGLKTSEKDANGNLTQYIYDNFDRLWQVQYPSTTLGSGTVNAGDYEAFGYDANGNKTSWRRRDGRSISYSYDKLNRELLHSASDGSAPTLYTDYNLLGGVCVKAFSVDITTQGPNCTTLFTSLTTAGAHYKYDGLGRVLAATDSNGRTLNYQYNAASSRTRLTWPDNAYVVSTLDNLNRVTQASWSNGAVVFSQAFNSLGQRKKLLRGAAIPTSEYSDATCATATGASCYAYDGAGRLTSFGNDLSGTANDINWRFAYNPVSQLVRLGATSSGYEYVDTPAATSNKTYDGLNRDATIAAVAGGGYDNNGNLRNDGTRFMVYDIYNHLVSVATSSTATPYLTLSYDPEGRLASSTYNGAVTSFLYDGTNLIGEYASSSASAPLTQRYVHGAGVDEPLAWYQGTATSTPYFFFDNYQGSVVAVTNAAGAIDTASYPLTALYKYGPYGEPKNAANTDSWNGARFRYTGQTMLYEAKLYHYKARVYDPGLGRFLQTDPIGTKDNLNLYAYVSDDPMNKTDTEGKCGTICIGFVGGAIIGGAFEGYSQYKAGKFDGQALLGGALKGGILGAAAGAGNLAALGLGASAVTRAVAGAAAAATASVSTDVTVATVKFVAGETNSVPSPSEIIKEGLINGVSELVGAGGTGSALSTVAKAPLAAGATVTAGDAAKAVIKSDTAREVIKSSAENATGEVVTRREQK